MSGAEHAHLEEAAAIVAAPGRMLSPSAAGPVATVLSLQRAAGNRAVNRLLAREESQAVSVSEYVSEDLINKSDKGETTFHWTAKFDAEIFSDRIVGHLKIRTYSNANVDYDEARKVRQDCMAEFQRLFNDKFVVEEEVDWAINPKRKLWLGIDFLNDQQEGEHVSVNIHKGAGADNRQNWYTGSPGIAHAHEAAHMFGLLDEYVDTNVKNRSWSGAAGVFEDHSIMGAFPAEGVDEAKMQKRHALRIATLIFKAAGKPNAQLTIHKK